jgi:hypothetical protein
MPHGAKLAWVQAGRKTSTTIAGATLRQQPISVQQVRFGALARQWCVFNGPRFAYPNSQKLQCRSSSLASSEQKLWPTFPSTWAHPPCKQFLFY